MRKHITLDRTRSIKTNNNQNTIYNTKFSTKLNKMYSYFHPQRETLLMNDNNIIITPNI